MSVMYAKVMKINKISVRDWKVQICWGTEIQNKISVRDWKLQICWGTKIQMQRNGLRNRNW
jgi:hypothetical protein